MNNRLVDILMGALVGAAIGSVITRSVLKDKYEKFANEQIESVKDIYKQKRYDDSDAKKIMQEITGKSTEDLHELAHAAIFGDGTEPAGSVSCLDTTHPLDSDEDDWNNGKAPEGYLDELTQMEELAQEYSAERKRNEPPFLISSEEFGSETFQECVTYLWYVDDQTLTTEEEEVVSDIHGLIGDVFETTSFNYSDQPQIYIRNLKRGMDMEILKIFGSYADREESL